MYLRQSQLTSSSQGNRPYGRTWIAIVIVVSILLAVSAVSVRAWFTKTAVVSRLGVAAPQSAVATAAQNPQSQGYVRRAQLWPQLRDALRVLGDRLEKPGRERLILVGALSRSGNENLPVRLILEYPDKLRLEETGGVTVFNGSELRTSKSGLSQRDEDEVESLLFDSVEHFFNGRTNGLATRYLGSRFRMDNGTTPNYRGPFYDLYQVADRITLKRETSYQPKTYYLNSDSLLLERVRYQHRATRATIEVQLSNWQKIAGQYVPGRIVRVENGNAVMSLAITAAVIGPRLNDGIFSRP